MRKEKITTFLTEAEVKFIDMLIMEGYATSRSEAVRKAVLMAMNVGFPKLKPKQTKLKD